MGKCTRPDEVLAHILPHVWQKGYRGAHALNHTHLSISSPKTYELIGLPLQDVFMGSVQWSYEYKPVFLTISDSYVGMHDIHQDFRSLFRESGVLVPSSQLSIRPQRKNSYHCLLHTERFGPQNFLTHYGNVWGSPEQESTEGLSNGATCLRFLASKYTWGFPIVSGQNFGCPVGGMVIIKRSGTTEREWGSPKWWSAMNWKAMIICWCL